jgi:hypothetical protein
MDASRVAGWTAFAGVIGMLVTVIYERVRGGMTEKQIRAAQASEAAGMKESLKALDVERAKRERERRLRKSWGIPTAE